MARPTFTIPLKPTEADRLRRFFLEHGFELRDAPHAFWQARGPGCVATFYRSGKLLLQGSEADAWRGLLGDDTPAARPFHAGLARHPRPLPEEWIGTDEAGKGDYFGPLVVAGVALKREAVEILATLGVADSKTVGDARLRSMVPALAELGDTEVLAISPARYNQLHAKIGNLNRLLAWAHAKVIENLLERGAARYVVVDRFADEAVLRRALGPRGREVRVDQRPRAEDDPAVAAASILARAAYLRALAAASRKLGVELPAGAGPPVLAAGRRLVAKHGRDVLGEVAKVHFATTRQILGE